MKQTQVLATNTCAVLVEHQWKVVKVQAWVQIFRCGEYTYVSKEDMYRTMEEKDFICKIYKA